MPSHTTDNPSSRSAVLLAWLVSRLGLFLWAWAGLVWSPTLVHPDVWRGFPRALWLDGWARWDSGWYESIGNHGYSYSAGTASNVNFFPLYPALTRLFALPLSGVLPEKPAFFAAGWAVSHLAFAAALAGMARWVRTLSHDASAGRAVWLLALFPFSFFFSAVYTESLFLALAVWAFAFSAESRWWPAAACAALAAITRIPGGLVGVGVGVAFLQQRAWQGPAGRRHLLALAVIPLPLVALCAWHARTFGDPLVFLHTQATWGRHFSAHHLVAGVVEIVRNHDPVIRAKLVTYLGFAALFGLLTLRMAWQRRWPAMVYTAASLFIAFGTSTDSGGRYLAVMFPAFLELAEILSTPRRLGLWWLATVPFLAWFTHIFCHFGEIY